MAGECIQSLWIGPHLSTMERLSIASFLHHGHDYRLFTYGPVEGVPPGAVVEDARAVLPESMIFRYRDRDSYAGFSNFFRYKLLFDRGGWWVDTDAVCLRPFDFDEPYVIATEPDGGGGEEVTSSFLQAPAGSPALEYAWESCRSRRPQDLAWGETGPRLVSEVVDRFDLGRYRQPSPTFCPIGYRDWEQFTDPAAARRFGEATRAAHLWHEMWRLGSRDKDGDYPPGCLYETWKRLYLGPSGLSATRSEAEPHRTARVV